MASEIISPSRCSVHLLPKPSERHDEPTWSEPAVGSDHFAQVAMALYTLPTCYRNRKLTARADRTAMRFYLGSEIVKTHVRQHPGGKAVDPTTSPRRSGRTRCARWPSWSGRPRRTARQWVALIRRCSRGRCWTRMRRACALLGLRKRYGTRVKDACRRGSASEMPLVIAWSG